MGGVGGGGMVGAMGGWAGVGERKVNEDVTKVAADLKRALARADKNSEANPVRPTPSGSGRPQS